MKDALLEKAQQILEKHWNGEYTNSNLEGASIQYALDSCCAVIGNSYQHTERAAIELFSLFEGQWSNGMLPHCIYRAGAEGQLHSEAKLWQSQEYTEAPQAVATSGLAALPIHAQIVLHYYQYAEDKEKAKATLETLYPKLLDWHNYLYTYRDPQEEGLIHITHPWESLIPNAPVWTKILDEIKLVETQQLALASDTAAAPNFEKDPLSVLAGKLRALQYEDQMIIEQAPFLVQDPVFNTFLVWSNEALIGIGHLLGKDVSSIIQLNELTIYSINEKLWDENSALYFAYDLKREQLASINGILGLLPVIGEVPTQEQAEEMLLTMKGSLFGAKQEQAYFCPSYRMDSPEFNAVLPARGAIDLLANWLLYYGSLRYDFDDLAARIYKDSMDLLHNYSFRAHYASDKEALLSAEMSESLLSAAISVNWLSEIS